METYTFNHRNSPGDLDPRGYFKQPGASRKRRKVARNLLRLLRNTYYLAFPPGVVGVKRMRATLLAILFVLAWVFILSNPPDNRDVKIAHAQAPTSAPDAPGRVLTDADYYEPLNAYLKHTPMAGTGKAFWEAEKRTTVKKELLMGIAWAETNYNRNPQRGSKYNAFSICSHDSTNTTCEYNSYEEAINAAAYYLTDPRTILGSMNYRTVGDLSRATNKTGPIWASSEFNWQNNVLSEISRITGKPADPSWAWRTR